MSLEMVLRSVLTDDMVAWYKEKLRFHRSGESTSALSEKEIQRRKEIVERTLARRAQLPPLGMSTAELVHLARQGLESYDEN